MLDLNGWFVRHLEPYKISSDYCIEMRFEKIHGAGNDFILIDDRLHQLSLSQQEIAKMCDRHFGVGADGLMLLRNSDTSDFEMVYYNSDGRESSMCGNGGRCIVRFAEQLGMIGEKCTFLAVDGLHEAQILDGELIALQMQDVNEVEVLDHEALLLNTGSPHYVQRVQGLEELDLISAAHAIRYNDRFKEAGVNVNFVEINGSHINIRTYERGVEGETLACGTGVTAAAIAAHYWGDRGHTFQVNARGGKLEVRFEAREGKYRNVWKTGPTAHVFTGNWIG